MAITYSKEDHKQYIREQTSLICMILDIDYIDFTKDNYLQIRQLLSSRFSGTPLKRYGFDLNTIVFANQLFEELDSHDS